MKKLFSLFAFIAVLVAMSFTPIGGNHPGPDATFAQAGTVVGVTTMEELEAQIPDIRAHFMNCPSVKSGCSDPCFGSCCTDCINGHTYCGWGYPTCHITILMCQR